jgi:hypothetical protein
VFYSNLVVLIASFFVPNMRIRLLRYAEGQRVMFKKTAVITSIDCIIFKDILMGNEIIIIIIILILCSQV